MVRTSTIVEVIPELVPVDHKMVLDAGCGVGTILEALKKRGADIWGIEPGADNIAIARQRNPEIAEQFQVAARVVDGNVHLAPAGFDCKRLTGVSHLLRKIE